MSRVVSQNSLTPWRKSFRLARDQVEQLETAENLHASRLQADNFFLLVLFFRTLEGIAKHLLVVPPGVGSFPGCRINKYASH